MLVVDDEHLVATGIANHLRSLGHDVVAIASDGESAWAAAEEHQPDLALVDIQMPGVLGTEVAIQLYQRFGVPSLIVSAYSDDEYLEQIGAAGESSGVYGYVLKPVGRDELRMAMGVARQRAATDVRRVEAIGRLEKNLANRRAIEQAKWKLVEMKGMTEPEAHDWLQKVARRMRAPLVDVARRVSDGDDEILSTRL